MGTRQLEHFFAPETIAVIGASDRTGSMGGAVLRNILDGGFKGKVYPVNSKGYSEVSGLKAYTSIRKINAQIDLAIVCTPPETVAKVLAYLDRSGVPAAIVLSGGLSRTQGFVFGRVDVDRILDRMKMRVMGPECLGLISPHNHLNASYSHVQPQSGNIAYIGQSGTFGSAMLDWAVGRNIGFSHFVALGQSADVRLSDVADYLLSDVKTKAVVIQLDRISNAQRLIRSLRTLARRKPVVGLVTDSSSEEELATLGLNTADDVYTSALSRAGVLRVESIDELFHMAEVLTRMRPLYDGAIAVLGNGKGTTEFTGRLIQNQIGSLKELSNHTLANLKKHFRDMPISNPVSLPIDVSPQDFETALEILVEAKEVDALVVTFAPTRGVNSLDMAKAVTRVARNTRKNIFAIWIGEATVEESRNLLDHSGALTFESPHQAVNSLNKMLAHQRHQTALSETPMFMPLPAGDISRSHDIIGYAEKERRNWLHPKEVIKLLTLYGIKQVHTVFSKDIDGLAALAESVGYPVALKVVHKDYCLPFAYGSNPQNRWRGVTIGIKNGLELVGAAGQLQSELKQHFPEARLLNFSVQPVKRTLDVPQFSAGISRHPTLGPVIFLGQGGARSDIFSDRRVAVPPLNTTTATRLIEKTRLKTFIDERSEDPETVFGQLVDFLLKLNQLSAQQKRLAGLELNGFIHPEDGVLILGSAAEIGEKLPQLFRSYPANLAHESTDKHGSELTIRPVMAEDELYLQDFLNQLSPEAMAFRFFSRGKKLRHQDMVQLSQIDYDREMALIALDKGQILGEVRVWIDPDSLSAEYAVVVADEAKGRGIGKLLMKEIEEYCRTRKVILFYGLVLNSNAPMLGLAQSVGLEVQAYKGGEELITLKTLLEPKSTWQRNKIKALFDIEL